MNSGDLCSSTAERRSSIATDRANFREVNVFFVVGGEAWKGGVLSREVACLLTAV